MDLHKEFVKLSFDIIKMKNKLISLLLEIYEQEIYKQHHCRTIHEYGFKYAKLSKEMVEKVIRTLRHLEGKPFLKKAIETQGIHKVAMVATIATPENERVFAGHVENLSKPALFEFSKELRWKQQNEKVLNQEAMFGRQDGDAQRNEKVPGQEAMFGEQAENVQRNGAEASRPGASAGPQFCQAIPNKMTIELDAEMQILFLKFKGKYAKNLSNREALRVILKRVDAVGDKAEMRDQAGGMNHAIGRVGERENVNSMQVKTDEVVSNCGILKSGEGGVAEVVDQESEQNYVPGDGIMKHPAAANNSTPMSKTTFPSRYIHKKKDREIREKYQHKCAYPGCVKTVEVMHHRVPFAFERSHESVIPLCKIHHEFAHNGVIGHELKEPEEWTLKITGRKSIYDGFYLNKRRG